MVYCHITLGGNKYMQLMLRYFFKTPIKHGGRAKFFRDVRCDGNKHYSNTTITNRQTQFHIYIYIYI